MAVLIYAFAFAAGSISEEPSRPPTAYNPNASVCASARRWSREWIMKHPPIAVEGTGMRDPVCEMPVTSDSPHRTVLGGRKVLFCSAACKAKYEADPVKYHAASGKFKLAFAHGENTDT